MAGKKSFLENLSKSITMADSALAVPGAKYKDGSDITPLKLLDSPFAAARTAISEAQKGNFKGALPEAAKSFLKDPEASPSYSDILQKTGVEKGNADKMAIAIGMLEPGFGGKAKNINKISKIAHEIKPLESALSKLKKMDLKDIEALAVKGTISAENADKIKKLKIEKDIGTVINKIKPESTNYGKVILAPEPKPNYGKVKDQGITMFDAFPKTLVKDSNIKTPGVNFVDAKGNSIVKGTALGSLDQNLISQKGNALLDAQKKKGSK